MPGSDIFRFASRAVLFVALQCGIAAALVPLAARRGQEGYLAATLDKHARLDALRGRRRLFIVGGSTGAFGFDSAAVERATGREVVNLAIHVGLGQPVILAEGESAAGPGDEIWLSTEFQFLWREPTLTEELWELLCARPAAWWDLRLIPVKTLLDHGPFQFLGHVTRRAWQWVRQGTESPRGLYHRSGFDERGDYVGHAGREPPRPLSGRWLEGAPLPESSFRAGLARLQRVVRTCEAEGATVRIVLPVMEQEAFDKSRPELERVVAELERLFPGRVVGGVDDVPVPNKSCFDTPLHLTREAAIERTRAVLTRAGYPAARTEPAAAIGR